MSGPITDRIDIVRHVEPIRRPRVDLPFERAEASADVRRRVSAARKRQRARYAGASWRLNAHAPGPVLAEQWPLSPAAAETLDNAVYDGALTQRGATRVHRLAWTVADLCGVEQPGIDEVATALALRMGDPLSAELVTGRRVG